MGDNRLMAALAKGAAGPRRAVPARCWARTRPRWARAVARPGWAVAALLAVVALALPACGKAGASSTTSSLGKHSSVIVSLTFDDGDESQYTLGYQHGLQPVGLHGTFYIATGNTGNPGAMSWSQLSYLYQHGNDVGGHTVHHIDLASSSYSLARKTAEVCGSYRALAQRGLHPVSFSYPYGAYNTADERVAAKCGFRTARSAGGVNDRGPGAGRCMRRRSRPMTPTRSGPPTTAARPPRSWWPTSSGP
jgi:peptidoglycan/xylan/chitin deacetylase (PgdA/CDA1 family)